MVSYIPILLSLSLLLCPPSFYFSAGHPFLDLLCLAEEPVPKAGVTMSCFPLGRDDACQSVTPAQVTCLRKDVFIKGQVRGETHTETHY